MIRFFLALFSLFIAVPALAAPLSFTVNMSEAVNVTGTPRISVNVGGVTRYADYASGTGTSALTFTYTPQAGDVDLDGVAVSSPVDLNGGAITDLNGNAISNLTFTPPNTANVKVDYPSLSMDFTGSDYILSGTHYGTLSSFLTAASGSFTRGSVGTYFDSTGTLQTAGNNVARFDHDPTTHAAKGILIEEQRTNYIKNNQFSGISVGTNASTANWAIYNGAIAGTTITVTGTGSLNGIPYIDVRFVIPTNTTGGYQYPNIGMPFADAATVSNGTKTVLSSWFGVSSYSATGGVCTVGYSNRSYTTGGAYISEASTYFTATAPYSYRVSPVMTHGATAGKSYFSVYISTPNGVSCDITIRLGAPQFEIGAFPTSVIPTSGAAVTRQADIVDVPTGAWFNINNTTLFVSGEVSGAASGGTFPVGIGTDGSDYFGFPYVTTSGFGGHSYYRSAGAGPVIGGAALIFNTLYKAGYAFSTSVGTSSYSKNGALSGTGVGVNAMSSATTLGVGHSMFNPSLPASGHIQKLKYYPARVADTQLQLLTQ